MKTLINLSNLRTLTSVILLSVITSISSFAFPLNNEQSDSEILPTVEPWMNNLNEFDNDEPELMVEDWMLNLNTFDADEPAMEVEAWMYDYSAMPEEAFETELLAVETWMTDLNEFMVEEEQPLIVEAWMTDMEEYFHDVILLAMEEENQLEVENWMTCMVEFEKVPAYSIETIKTIELDDEFPIMMALKY